MKINSANIWNIENAFHYYADPYRIHKIICHYEIFKKTSNIPGSIVECGVFKGNSLFRFLVFRNIITKSIKKHVYGFDVFGKFPSQSNIKDNNFAKHHNNKIGLGINFNKITNNLKNKKFNNFTLIKGPVDKTLYKFLKKKKKFKISFLHLDLDVYKPTYDALNALFDKVSKGGIILLDDYGKVQGATLATHDYLKSRKIKQKIETLKFDKSLKFIIKK